MCRIQGQSVSYRLRVLALYIREFNALRTFDVHGAFKLQIQFIDYIRQPCQVVRNQPVSAPSPHTSPTEIP